MIEPIYSHTYQLTAGEAGPESCMPLALLAGRVIEVATEHANALRIGYEQLIAREIGWVLSRMSIEVLRYPEINEEYTVTTWIESYNRRFSERCFIIKDAGGCAVAYVRTVWAAIDMRSRALADLSEVEPEALPCADIECPVGRVGRIVIVNDADCERESYTFRYSDLDFNRHVNTVRYLDLILNHWQLGHYDCMAVGRLDIIFSHECYFGDTVELFVANDGDVSLCELRRGGCRAVAARIKWSQRNVKLKTP